MKEKVIHLLQEEINEQIIPGAVISVSHHDKNILQEVVGYKSIYPEKSKMTVDTVFDLASLTKVVATLPVILKLLEQGEFKLEDRVSFFIPEFKEGKKKDITIQHLLTHTSGLPSHRRYYMSCVNVDEVLENIYKEDLDYETGTKVVYSDLGLILLYKLIEVVTKMNFEEFVEQEIFIPLQMNETGFNLPFDVDRFAPTEYCERRKAYKQGVVHDENAEAMGGISGHAGLFSTVNDLQKFASMIENNGVFQGKRILSEDMLRLSRKNFTPFDQEYRGLGWLLQNPERATWGSLFSDSAFGHTGFTGTSIVFDPEIDMNVILLTNRVHFGRDKPIIKLRARLHQMICNHILNS